MGVRCSLCGRTFRTAQGRRGHLNFYHGLGKDTPFTRAIRWTINRHKDGLKKLEEEKIENKTKSEERRAKAMDVLRKYERSMGATDKVESEYLPKKSFEGLKKALLRHEPQNRLEGFEGLKKGLMRWK